MYFVEFLVSITLIIFSIILLQKLKLSVKKSFVLFVGSSAFLIIMLFVINQTIVHKPNERVVVSNINSVDFLKVGIINITPPYIYYDASGNITGLEVDILNSVAQKLQKDIIFIDIQPDNVINALEHNSVDIVAGGIKKGSFSEKYIDYTKPYKKSTLVIYSNVYNYNNVNSFLIKKGNKNNNLSAGAQIYQYDFQALTNLFNKDNILIKSYFSQEELLKDVEEGKTSFGLSDKSVVEYYTLANENTNLKIFPLNKFKRDIEISFVVKKGSHLKSMIN